MSESFRSERVDPLRDKCTVFEFINGQRRVTYFNILECKCRLYGTNIPPTTDGTYNMKDRFIISERYPFEGRTPEQSVALYHANIPSKL